MAEGRETTEQERRTTNRILLITNCVMLAIGGSGGLDDYLYAYGVARLPVSTSALIIASQLAFTALFAFLLFVIGTFASLFNIVGMIINNDFKVISREAKHFGLGEANYYVVLVGTAILWQAFFLGAIGVIYCASSLLSGIIIAVMLPITEVLAVVFYKEKFKAEKGVSLILSVWGFAYYFYGEYKQAKKMKRNPILETGEVPQVHITVPKDQ
ncbi:hypothetical protein RIF29_11950 [Crotalaria pallida]|uniref:Uncharacterized protein n=1 Tax=Crotalaria pallida TaxID=3830 RepID=A0AAN9P0P1_CROPI